MQTINILASRWLSSDEVRNLIKMNFFLTLELWAVKKNSDSVVYDLELGYFVGEGWELVSAFWLVWIAFKYDLLAKSFSRVIRARWTSLRDDFFWKWRKNKWLVVHIWLCSVICFPMYFPLHSCSAVNGVMPLVSVCKYRVLNTILLKRDLRNCFT